MLAAAISDAKSRRQVELIVAILRVALSKELVELTLTAGLACRPEGYVQERSEGPYCVVARATARIGQLNARP